MNISRNIKATIFLVTAGIVVVIIFLFLNTKDVDIRKAKTEMSVSTKEFIHGFEHRDRVAYKDYIEKAIEVNGVLHKITSKKDTYTLLLKGQEIDTFVLCEMKKDQNNAIMLLNKGDNIKIKGILKGFLQDAIILNCIILEDNNE